MKRNLLGRVLALVLVLCMVVSVCPVKAQAATAEEAVKNLVELLKAHCPEVNTAASNTVLELVPGRSTRYVALGDGTAVSGYPEVLAQKLGIQCENLANAEYTVENQQAVVLANRDAIAQADLISVGFGLVPVVNESVDQILNNEAVVDWTPYVSSEEEVAEILAAVEEVSKELVGIANARVYKAIEIVAFSSVAYACEMPKLLDEVREINPTADILVVGMYDPLEGVTVELMGKSAKLSGYLNYIADTAATYAGSYCAEVPNAVYVDARNVQTQNTDTTLNTEDLRTMVAANSAALNPSQAGHAYIAEQMENALKIDVERKEGANRYETSFAIADEMKEVLGVEKFDAVVLANSDNFADALAGSYLAAVKKAPIIITKAKYAQLTCEYLNENLNDGAYIYVLGGTAAMPGNILETLEVNATVCRLEGKDRYATNLAILDEADIGDKDLLVATGLSFADSLSASATGLPILLVNSKPGKSLTQEQKNFLKGVEGDIYILGGESAVNAEFEAEIEAVTNKSVTRIAGGSRYETSVEIAAEFLPGATSAVVAYAGDFPDGLCGGPLAYAMGAPLLLTKSGKTEAPEYTVANSITTGYVLGGEGLISGEMTGKIFG